LSYILDKAVDEVGKWFADTALFKWIVDAMDWWDNFSIKEILAGFWNKLKNWIFEQWNRFCDWLARQYIVYPTGADVRYTGDPSDNAFTRATHFWRYRPFFEWDEWHPFGFLVGWKADIPQYESVQDQVPMDMQLNLDQSRQDELQQFID